ncbi:hypothetical protein BC830DRAFT_1106293 [Chytriomyces sp. MP71]|nr:hypothetical protein BC830DRAFT_1106293 [Chytriomyces sp. MP71]
MDTTDEIEAEVPLSAWTSGCVSASLAVSGPSRVLVVCCSADAAQIVSTLAPAQTVRAALVSPGMRLERNSWSQSVHPGNAGGCVSEINPDVLAVDLSSIDTGIHALSLVQTLFNVIGGAPSHAVIVLDRIKGVGPISDRPALITSSSAVLQDPLAAFPKFLPPNILTGLSAAIITYCEANNIPAYGFVAQDSNASVFAESRVLELFGVETTASSLGGKLTALQLKEVNRKHVTQLADGNVTALFL